MVGHAVAIDPSASKSGDGVPVVPVEGWGWVAVPGRDVTARACASRPRSNGAQARVSGD